MLPHSVPEVFTTNTVQGSEEKGETNTVGLQKGGSVTQGG